MGKSRKKKKKKIVFTYGHFVDECACDELMQLNFAPRVPIL